MVSDPKLFDHVAACELAEKRAIAVYGAVFASFVPAENTEDFEDGAFDAAHAHEMATAAAQSVPRPEPYRVPTALERQQAAANWEARK